MGSRQWPSGAGSPGYGQAERRRDASPAGQAVVIVDVPVFADIRGRHGPVAAEQVTQMVADNLRRRLRGADRLALLREDEFLAVIADADDAALESVVPRLRAAVQGTRVALAEDEWVLGCTLGAAARASGSCALDALVRAADIALYRARLGTIV